MKPNPKPKIRNNSGQSETINRNVLISIILYCYKIKTKQHHYKEEQVVVMPMVRRNKFLFLSLIWLSDEDDDHHRPPPPPHFDKAET
jgi:hypothetical protein